MRGRTCPPSSSCAGTTGSSRPPSCGGWHKTAWAASPTRSPAAIAPRSATRKNLPICLSATSTDWLTPDYGSGVGTVLLAQSCRPHGDLDVVVAVPGHFCHAELLVEGLGAVVDGEHVQD